MARQNVYDDDRFFAGYQEMRDAGWGINEAVEQPAMLARLPELDGATVVDLGCGDGWLCRELARLGATDVLGVDPSARMLELARERSAHGGVEYRRGFAEDLRLPNGSVDLVVSSLAFHYIGDLAGTVASIAGWLRPGGRLLASMEHPVVTAAPRLGPHPCVVAGYADEGRRDTTWYIPGVVKYHRRISTVVDTVVAAGLNLLELAEPTPTAAALSTRPDLDRHRQRPSILIVSARKPDRG